MLILVTLSGMVTVVSAEHPLNAKLPMLVTLFPMINEVRLVQSWNAKSSILVTLSGMVTEPFFPDGHCINVVMSLLYKTPSMLEYTLLSVSTLIAARTGQSEKALVPIPLTPLPMFAEVREVQSMNA